MKRGGSKKPVKSEKKCDYPSSNCKIGDIDEIFEKECKDFGVTYHPVVFDAVAP